MRMWKVAGCSGSRASTAARSVVIEATISTVDIFGKRIVAVRRAAVARFDARIARRPTSYLVLRVLQDYGVTPRRVQSNRVEHPRPPVMLYASGGLPS